MSQVPLATLSTSPFSFESLAAAWEELKIAKTDAFSARIKISAGWDDVGLRAFERQRDQHLHANSRKVRSGRYTFRPFLSHEVPKEGGTRTIAYSGIRDRIVQAALHKVLVPAVEPHLTDSAFAYRASRGAHDAAFEIFDCANNGLPFFLKSDFVQFFDRIDHARLRSLINALDLEPEVHQLTWRFIRTGSIARDLRPRVHPVARNLGVPQGGVVSGVLSNLFLADFDHALRRIEGARLIRYADDFVVMCADPTTCNRAFAAAQDAAQSFRLALHEGDKTVKCGHIDDGFNFVGFRFRGTKVSVKPSNIGKFRSRVDAVLAKHEGRLRDGEYADARECVGKAVYHLNIKVSGVQIGDKTRSWMTYFRVVNDVDQIRRLDRWISKRLSAMCVRIGIPARRRSVIRALGYRGLVREYWRVRKRMRTRALVYRGFLRQPTE